MVNRHMDIRLNKTMRTCRAIVFSAIIASGVILFGIIFFGLTGIRKVCYVAPKALDEILSGFIPMVIARPFNSVLALAMMTILIYYSYGKRKWGNYKEYKKK